MVNPFCLLYHYAMFRVNSNGSVLLACTFLVINFLSSLTGFATGEIQYRNDLSQSTLFKVRKNLIKSRDKRQINIVSNKTVQVYIQTSPFYLLYYYPYFEHNT